VRSGSAATVQQLRALGVKKVIMLYDARALARAHVGIAMQEGADIARLTSDIALLEDAIERVADAKALANAAMKQIDNNFRLTVTANAGILAAAAAGKLTSVALSVLHSGTTIAILLNALRSSGGGPAQAVQYIVEDGRQERSEERHAQHLSENTATDVAWRISEPPLVENARVTTPISIADEVIRVGRSRMR
jgi:hypothetical protein